MYLLFLTAVFTTVQAYDGPIIDMHYHALPNGAEGPPDHPDNVAYMEQALEQLRTFNVIYAATSGPPNFLDYWQTHEPERLLTSPTFPCVNGLTPTYNRQPCFQDGGNLPEPGWLEQQYRSGRFSIMGELMNQYAGIPYDDPRMEPYYEIAEKHGIPVAFHIHAGPPGIREACCPDFRLSLGDPILLEEVLVKYPDMKVQIMHANTLIYPVIMDMLMQYPQVYVDISPFHLTLTQEEFHRLLKHYQDHRMLKRVMFGSDMTGLSRTIAAYESADFLSDKEMAGVMCRNAARFLGLKRACRKPAASDP